MENLTYLVYLFSFQLSTGLFVCLVLGSVSLIPSVLFLFAFLCCWWFHAVSIPLLFVWHRFSAWATSKVLDSLQLQHRDLMLRTWLPALLTVSALCKWAYVSPAYRKEISGHYLMDSPFSNLSGHWELFISFSLLLVSWYLPETKVALV